MLLDFIATVAAAFAAAGIVLFLMRVLKVRLPKWILPVAAGGAMIAFAIWSEYSWKDRQLGTLPPDTRVVLANAETSWWRPWTYAFPLVTRFTAIVRSEMKTHEALEGVLFLNVYSFGRWERQRVATVAIDCVRGRGIELSPGQDFPVRAQIPDEDWQALPSGDPVLVVACSEG